MLGIVAVFSGNRKKQIIHSGKNTEIFKPNQVVRMSPITVVSSWCHQPSSD